MQQRLFHRSRNLRRASHNYRIWGGPHHTACCYLNIHTVESCSKYTFILRSLQRWQPALDFLCDLLGGIVHITMHRAVDLDQKKCVDHQQICPGRLPLSVVDKRELYVSVLVRKHLMYLSVESIDGRQPFFRL